ncbi:methyltransferase domain-containing protein [Actinoplanes sp. NPDC051851]|uniref:class I SAM-dependent methyltransferase n=1 Tax=Actinoplanes sp. NPDC051851 TaxID=3154753 RepID=UPI00342C7914
MERSGEIVGFYTERYDEAGRLERRPQSRLERIRTLELLRELLGEKGSVLDVGGGPGAYARELIADGHRVRLIDLVPAHVAQARAGEPPIDAVVGDARKLPEPDGTWDATLLLGPLYHLHDRDDRVRALREAIRVTRPGGRIAAAAISRFAGPVDLTATGRWDPNDGGRMREHFRELIDDGRNDASIGFTEAYFHRVGELIGECREAGLREIVVHGVEGPAWAAAEAAAKGPDADRVFAAALELARLYSSEPDVIAASSHLLVTGAA